MQVKLLDGVDKAEDEEKGNTSQQKGPETLTGTEEG